MALRNYTNTATEATLVAAVTGSDANIGLAAFAGFPAPPFTAAIDRGTASEEVVLVTAVSGATVTTTRGYDGTTAKSHATGASFLHVTVAKDYDEANDHVNAAAAHGTTGAVVGTTDAQTLTNKTLTLPALVSPTATGTSTFTAAAFTGSVSFAGAVILASGSVTGDLTVGGILTSSGVHNAPGGLTAASLSVSGATTLTGTTAAGLVTSSVPATAASHLVRKDYADALGVSAPTVSTIARRDAAGRFQAVTPSVAADVAIKGYVDGKFADTGWVDLTINAPATVLGSAKYRVLNGVCYINLATTSGSGTSASFVLTTLPVDARPPRDYWMLAFYQSGVTSQVTVSTTGTVTLLLASGAGAVVFSGSFPVT